MHSLEVIKFLNTPKQARKAHKLARAFNANDSQKSRLDEKKKKS